MFHKKTSENLEELSMDFGLQMWYDIYVGRLSEAACFFLLTLIPAENGRYSYFMETFMFFN